MISFAKFKRAFINEDIVMSDEGVSTTALRQFLTDHGNDQMPLKVVNISRDHQELIIRCFDIHHQGHDIIDPQGGHCKVSTRPNGSIQSATVGLLTNDINAVDQAGNYNIQSEFQIVDEHTHQAKTCTAVFSDASDLMLLVINDAHLNVHQLSDFMQSMFDQIETPAYGLHSFEVGNLMRSLGDLVTRMRDEDTIARDDARFVRIQMLAAFVPEQRLGDLHFSDELVDALRTGTAAAIAAEFTGEEAAQLPPDDGEVPDEDDEEPEEEDDEEDIEDADYEMNEPADEPEKDDADDDNQDGAETDVDDEAGRDEDDVEDADYEMVDEPQQQTDTQQAEEPQLDDGAQQVMNRVEPAQQPVAQTGEMINGMRYLGTWDPATTPRADDFQIIFGRHTVDEFKQLLRSVNALAIPHLDPSTPFRYFKCREDAPNGFDRIEFMLVKGNTMKMYDVIQRKHPTVTVHENVPNMQALLTDLTTQDVNRWSKSVWGMHTKMFDKSATGILVTYDEHRFYAMKRGIPSPCPFRMGKLVPTDQNALVGQIVPAQQNPGQQAQPRAPRQPRRQVNQAQVAQLEQSIKQFQQTNDLFMADVKLSLNNAGRRGQMPRDNNPYVIVTFCGIDKEVLIGEAAENFLKELDMWDDMVESIFNLAVGVYPNIKLAVQLDGKLEF